MKPRERELARIAILEQLEAASAFGLPAATVARGLAHAGYEIDAGGVEAELDYLVDKGLARKVQKVISPEIGRWAITAHGRDLLAGGA